MVSRLGGISGTAIAALLAGTVLAWSGLRGRTISTTARDLLSGQNPADSSATTTANSMSTVPTVTGSSTDTGTNKSIAKVLAAPYGWSNGTQWDDLDQLWTRESSWSNTALNPSGAFGIPQALPSSKLPKAGQPVSSGGKADPSSQIRWGLSYIKDRYGSPSKALAHENSAGWY